MTAVANSVFTAAQFNTYVRDNLNATAPALATASGQYFVATGVNALAARAPITATVATTETTTSTSYTDLTTVGPQVTVTTGTSALVFLYSTLSNSGTASSLVSYAVSGASSIVGSDTRSIGGNFPSGAASLGGVFLETGLTPGSNIFKCTYRVTAGTGTFQNRRLLVMPLS